MIDYENYPFTPAGDTPNLLTEERARELAAAVLAELVQAIIDTLDATDVVAADERLPALLPSDAAYVAQLVDSARVEMSVFWGDPDEAEGE